ncbi:MAG: PAS domain S-box protein, partial [Syntrophobacterales bacterium]
MLMNISKIIERLSPILNSFIRTREIDMEERRRRLISAFFLLAGIPVLFAFAIFHILKAEYMEAAINLAVSATLMVSLYSLRYLKAGLTIYRINLAFLACLFIYNIFVGGANGSRILWVYTYPLIALFLLGKKEGLLHTLVMFLLSLLVIFDPYATFGTFPYANEFKVRFTISFLLVLALTYAYETIRQIFRQELENERYNLSVERDKLRHITENVHDIVWYLDLATMRYMYMSPSIEHLTGFTVEEAMKQDPAEALSPESYERAMRVLDKELKLEKKEGHADKSRVTEMVWDYYHKDGHVMSFGVTMSFLRDEKGEPTGVIGVSRDIT